MSEPIFLDLRWRAYRTCAEEKWLIAGAAQIFGVRDEYAESCIIQEYFSVLQECMGVEWTSIVNWRRQQDVATVLDITRSVVSKWLRAVTPNRSEVFALDHDPADQIG